MGKNLWIYVTGGIVMLTSIVLGLLIPHRDIPLYFIALGILVFSEFLFFLQMVVKRQFTDWLPLNIVTAVWVIIQLFMVFLVQVMSARLFWISEVLIISAVAVVGSLTSVDSHYLQKRSEKLKTGADKVFQPKKGDY